MATTTNYGFEIPDDTDLVKDGALAMRDLGQDVDTQLFTALGGNYPGLRLVKKQTIGTSVASVTVTNAFSATYQQYRIVINGGTNSAQNYGRLILGASNTQYYYGGPGWGYAGGGSGVNGNNDSSFNTVWYAPSANFLDCNIELKNPFLTQYTGINFSFANSAIGGFVGAGEHKVAASYTDFTLAPLSGTMTGGTIYVYGYGIS
jgi:hypothetical protein